jgi:hypothetical protein
VDLGGLFCGRLVSLMGPSGGLLGTSWKLWGHLGGVLGLSGALLGSSGGLLGCAWRDRETKYDTNRPDTKSNKNRKRKHMKIPYAQKLKQVVANHGHSEDRVGIAILDGILGGLLGALWDRLRALGSLGGLLGPLGCLLGASCEPRGAVWKPSGNLLQPLGPSLKRLGSLWGPFEGLEGPLGTRLEGQKNNKRHKQARHEKQQKPKASRNQNTLNSCTKAQMRLRESQK